MRSILLQIAFTVLLGQLLYSQVNAGQIDDFENGTTMNWTDGGSTAAPSNVATGGPNGANDNYLSDPSLGGGGPGSKMVMFNDQQWAGNYTSEGIVSIRFHARALTNQLNLRVAFDGAGGRICTTNAVNIPAGGVWQQYEIPISASDFTLVAGGSNIGQTLADVTDIRILSNSVPSWQGESIIATLEIDNIEASNTLLSVGDFEVDEAVKIVSLEGNRIKIMTSSAMASQQPNLIIYDLYGRKLIDYTISNPAIIISTLTWEKGVYIAQLKSSNSRSNKKFVIR